MNDTDRMQWKRIAAWLGGVVLVAAVLMLARGDGEAEVDTLARLLDLRPGDTVADVGAGNGWLSIEVATLVGEAGRVFATELSARRRDDIREAVAAAGLDNVTVVEAGERETNLAPACCEAIFLRRVYHHLTDTAAFNASLHASLKPGGRSGDRRARVQRHPASSQRMAALDRRRAGRGRGQRGRADPRRDR